MHITAPCPGIVNARDLKPKKPSVFPHPSLYYFTGKSKNGDFQYLRAWLVRLRRRGPPPFPALLRPTLYDQDHTEK